MMNIRVTNNGDDYLVPHAKQCNDIFLVYFLGLDSKCDYSVGSFINSIAIWITVDACLCSRQALAILVHTSVCDFLFLSSFIFSPRLPS